LEKFFACAKLVIQKLLQGENLAVTRKFQAQQTKSRIIRHACLLFAEQGYDKVKITDICRASGISIGGFYHYFQTKQDIIDEVYITFDDHLQEMVERRGPKFATCKEAIRFIMKEEFDFPQTEGLVVPLMVFKVQLTLAKKNVLEESRYICQVLKEYVSKGIETGEFRRVKDVAGLVYHILRTSRGVIYDWCLRNGNYNLTQQGLADVEFILKYTLYVNPVNPAYEGGQD
jgi:AcrR family transcriptional regulator